MKSSHWDNLASHFEEEVFSVHTHDRKDLIRSALRKARRQGARTACDFGCGVGGGVQHLLDLFPRVYAVDFSKKCVDRLAQKHRGSTSLTTACINLAMPHRPLAPCDVVMAVNVHLARNNSLRSGLFKSMSRWLKRGGTLVAVFPSLESTLYTNFRHIQWNLKEGSAYNKATQTELKAARYSRLNDLSAGICNLDGVATKAYLREELEVILTDLGLGDLCFRKIEYDWTTEFNDPPAWMRPPGPWDWLVTARKPVPTR